MKLIKWAILFLLFSVPAEAQQNFNSYVMGLPVQTPGGTDFLYLLHNGVSSRTSVANFTTNPISTCGTAGAVAYYPAANNTVSCLPNITGGTNTLTLNSSMTLTLPDSSTWTNSGLSMLGTIAVTPTIGWSGSATNPPGFQPFYVNENLSGTSTAPNGSILNQNSITINDNLNAGGESSIANGLLVNDRIFSGALGNRQAIEAQVIVQASPADHDARFQIFRPMWD